MKTLFIALLLGGLACLSTGCATPAYSGGLPSVKFPEERLTGEHANLYVRNMMFDWKQLGDDWDSLLLLDPSSRLSKWQLR
jgi:hypothetical protein